jgi:hypothetical protein
LAGDDLFKTFTVTDSDFLTFDAIMTTTLGDARFTFGVDDFPPVGDGTQINIEQGILFDASGQPLRFDTPATSADNSAEICDPSCDNIILERAGLTLWDDDDFDIVFLNDSTITTLAAATVDGDAFTPFNGEWTFNPFDSISDTSTNSFYLIQAVPIPPAVWLFGSGLIGLIGVTRRKKAA